MSKVVFVVNSNTIHLYLWKCIERISKEMKGVDITIFLDENTKRQINHSFNPVIDLVDSKFSNLKKNPLELINLTDVITNHKNIKTTNKLKELTLSDWVIFESHYHNSNTFKSYTKNGILLLDLNQINLINSILSKSLIKLSILYNNQKINNWTVISSINLKKEIGLKNNFHKILFNYAIYLTKFLKNTKTTDNETINNTLIPQNSVKGSLFLKLKVVFYYIKLTLKIFARKIKKEQFNWKIGVKKNNEIFFLKQPKKSFWADPFIVKSNDDDLVVYFEELKSNNLGKISCVKIDSNLEIVEKEDIIDTEYHLSFPNVFFKNDSYYMIPESSHNNTLQLYKCIQFPFKWEFKMNLMENIKLLDAAWIHHNGLYWIFANKIEDFEYDNNERLYLYYSENLFSNEWKPHIKNPIITDASLARNAGDFILEKEKIKRVSQNCMNGYGQNIVINEVKLLTTNDYAEEKIDEIYPQKGYVGSHTLNKHKNVSVLDFLIKE